MYSVQTNNQCQIVTVVYQESNILNCVPKTKLGLV